MGPGRGRHPEQELFANRKRLADAERSLQVKETKKARENVRIAGNKIERAKVRLADLQRVEPKDRDSRIFPGVYAPVIVSEGGKLVIADALSVPPSREASHL